MAEQWMSRPYRQEDCPAVLDLIRSRPASTALDFPTLADMHEMLSVPDIARLTRIWETGAGTLAGYACLNTGDDYAFLIFECAPTFFETNLSSQMIDWGEQAYRKDYHGQAEELTTNAPDGNPSRMRLLEQHGFRFSGESTIYMERDLRQPIPDPVLPEGFSIRCLNGSEEAEAWVRLHRAAFGTQNMTVEYRMAMFQTPGYDPSLDLVTVAPDGSLAAYVVCSANAEEARLIGRKVGTTDPVATNPAYQRMGLSRALLFKGLALLRERGMDSARLGTGSDNTAMQKAAGSAGYRVTSRTLMYTKTIPRL